MPILIAILGFSILIVVHELGHFLVARATGMRVIKFSVGFGPAILAVQRGGTTYQIAAFPVGGFVQVAGMGPNQEDQGPGSYLEKPLWARAAMVSAGPLFNFGFAWLVYVYLFSSFNAVTYEWQREATAVVREVRGAAEAGGMQPWDTIEQINGERIRSFKDLQAATGKYGGEPMTIVVARPPAGERPPLTRHDTPVEDLQFALPVARDDYERVTLMVKPDETERGYLLGVSPAFGRFGATGIVASAGFATGETWAVLAAIGRTIQRWVAGTEKAQVASVVKITEIGADTVKMGQEWFLNLLALLSINLGLLNLLPFPALDGGRLVFIGIEAVARRPVPRGVEMAIHAVGMLVLLGLMVVVMAGEIAEKF